MVRRPVSHSTTKPQRKPLVVEILAIKDIAPNARNARRHSPKQIACLRSAIEKFGFTCPVLVGRDGVLIAGHARLEAAKQLGFQELPAIRMGSLNDAELRALALSDNRIAELATWDEDMLRIELKGLTALDLNFSISEVTGFEPQFIEGLVFSRDFDRPDAADSVIPEVRSGTPPVAKLGDLFDLGPHRIGCGDARDADVIRALLRGERVRQVIADPPYNVAIPGHVSGKGRAKHRNFAMASGEMSQDEFVAFNRDWLSVAKTAATPGALLYAFMDGLHLADLVTGARRAGLDLKTVCVWAKTTPGMGALYRSQTEHVAVFKNGDAAHINNVQLGRNGRNRSNLWTYPGMGSFGPDRDSALAAHPTVKPVGLLRDAILDVTKRGDAVLDPFLGSGSTIIAADRAQRRGFGLEIDPLYVDVALERVATVLGIDPVRTSDGAAWSHLKAQGGQP